MATRFELRKIFLDATGKIDASLIPATSINAANITSGTVATARLGSGTANSTTFLRGDQTWATPASGGWTMVRKPAPTTRTNNTVLADDPDLQFALTTGQYCIFRAVIFASVDASPDLKWGLAFSGSLDANEQCFFFGGSTQGASPSNANLVSNTLLTLPSGIAVTTSVTGAMAVHIDAVIKVTGSGTLSFQWSQNITSGNATTVLAGSHFAYQTF